MKSLDTYLRCAQEMTRERFLSVSPSPVLVAQEVMGGLLKRARGPKAGVTTRRFFTNRQEKTGTRVHMQLMVEEIERMEKKQDEAQAGGALARQVVYQVRTRHTVHPNQRISLGRSQNCDVVVDDHTVSKQHAWITLVGSDGPYSVTDCGSTNGTWLAGEQIASGQQFPLQSGDKLKLGRLVFRFLSAADFYRYLKNAEG